MITASEVRRLALSFEQAVELPHFEVTSFRIKSKIFVTLNEKENRACLKLSLVDQDVFCTSNKESVYRVPNAWGKYGWTNIDLKKIRKPVFRDALTCAFQNVQQGRKKPGM